MGARGCIGSSPSGPGGYRAPGAERVVSSFLAHAKNPGYNGETMSAIIPSLCLWGELGLLSLFPSGFGSALSSAKRGPGRSGTFPGRYQSSAKAVGRVGKPSAWAQCQRGICQNQNFPDPVVRDIWWPSPDYSCPRTFTATLLSNLRWLAGVPFVLQVVTGQIY